MSMDRAALAHLRHELRTPLNHIIGYSEMLLEDVAGWRPGRVRAGSAPGSRERAAAAERYQRAGACRCRSRSTSNACRPS